jgi:hypothetical protein
MAIRRADDTYSPEPENGRLAAQYAVKSTYFVILSEARNLSSVCVREKKERFFASLRMTKVSSQLLAYAV